MAVFNRWGMKLNIKRLATEADVKTHFGREPNTHDKMRMSMGMLVLTETEDGTEDVDDMAFFKADGGWSEVLAAAADAGCELA